MKSVISRLKIVEDNVEFTDGWNNVCHWNCRNMFFSPSCRDRRGFKDQVLIEPPAYPDGSERQCTNEQKGGLAELFPKKTSCNGNDNTGDIKETDTRRKISNQLFVLHPIF